MAVLVSLRDKDANILREILFEVMMLGRQDEPAKAQIAKRLTSRSGASVDLLEKLASQNAIFRYWP